jgi:hypothetical protein
MKNPTITIDGTRFHLDDGQALTIVRDNGETHVLTNRAGEVPRESDAAMSSQKLAEFITAFAAPNPVMPDIAIKNAPTPHDAAQKAWVIDAVCDYLQANLTDTGVADILQALRTHDHIVICAQLTNADLPEELA